MSSGIYRKRLACVECTRRKVKCDKILPCRNCARKGISCTRPRDRSSPASSIEHTGRQKEDSTASAATGALDIIQRLESQVKQLEAALEESKTRDIQQPTPTLRSTVTPTVPTTPSPREAQALTLEPEDSTGEVEDAATILEFLAWGRRKDPTYQDAIIQNSKPDHSPGDVTVEDEVDNANSPGYIPSSICQMLLPTQSKVHQLVKYHMDCLLWYHGALHAATFMQELNEFYDEHNGHIDAPGVNLQWVALLFAILTGSMTCAPRSVAQSWGFHSEEQETLSKRWLKATKTCLEQAEYMAYHSIYSVQAIASLTISAHMLGYSNGLSVLLASAVRIAQGLGLHRLAEEKETNQTTRTLINREIGRRVWCQLCIQDWFSIPFTESYLLHHQGFTTPKPQNSDDDMTTIPDHTPTVTSYSRLFYEIAALMPNLQDAISASNTPYTKYEQVLQYDRKMRTLATKHLPYYLQNVPLDSSWPCYVPWARRSLAISSAHKVIMIHRKFLSASFSNSMFEFTRKTCVAASRTIIKEQMEAVRDGGPVLWIHQAFSVTASIILCLDLFHQTGPERDRSEHRQLIDGGIEILSQCHSDMIAKRGVSLLKAMLADEQYKTSERRLIVGMHGRTEICHEVPGAQRHNYMNIPSIIRNFYQQDHAPLIRKRRCSEISDVGRWPELVRDESVNTPGVDFLTSLGLDCVGGLDEILNMAADYMN